MGTRTHDVQLGSGTRLRSIAQRAKSLAHTGVPAVTNGNHAECARITAKTPPKRKPHNCQVVMLSSFDIHNGREGIRPRIPHFGRYAHARFQFASGSLRGVKLPEVGCPLYCSCYQLAAGGDL